MSKEFRKGENPLVQRVAEIREKNGAKERKETRRVRKGGNIVCDKRR